MFASLLLPLAAMAVSPISDRTARPSAQADNTPSQPNPSNDAAAPIALDAALTVLDEGFDNIGALPGNGWSLQNLSTPVGSTNWFQGTNVAAGGPFDAFDGAVNAYIGANYNNTGSTGTISNWLLTPTLDFGADATLSFYTRKVSPDSYADRLEVRLSTNGASTNAGSNATTVGDFTTLKLSINPTLVLGVYPTVWTKYTITGLPPNGQGRIGFRYFVTSAGAVGTSSDYIGIDRVSYSSGPPQYKLGGNVAGLAGSGLVLKLNNANDLPVSATGAFSFGYQPNGSTYKVTVGTQPTNPVQNCVVTNDQGTITGADVSNVNVQCTTAKFAIGGSVSGLAGSGLTLQLNGANDLPVGSDGAFAFPVTLDDLSNYTVTVGNSPANPVQSCVVTNGQGSLSGADVGNIGVECTTTKFAVGGNVSGLAGSGLKLQLNGANDLPIASDGAFVFGVKLADHSNYTVTVGNSPTNPAQSCVVTNGQGSLAGGDVGNVDVQCTTSKFAVGGNVSGLAGTGLILKLNGANDLPITTEGPFAFPPILTDLSSYTVTVSASPTNLNQSCFVTNGSGSLAGAAVTSVSVTCITTKYTIAGEVSGLLGPGLVLQLNGGNDRPVNGNGIYAFSTKLPDGDSYTVSILTQPANAEGICVVTNESGVIAGDDVITVDVPCDVIFRAGFEVP